MSENLVREFIGVAKVNFYSEHLSLITLDVNNA